MLAHHLLATTCHCLSLSLKFICTNIIIIITRQFSIIWWLENVVILALGSNEFVSKKVSFTVLFSNHNEELSLNCCCLLATLCCSHDYWLDSDFGYCWLLLFLVFANCSELTLITCYVPLLLFLSYRFSKADDQYVSFGITVVAICLAGIEVLNGAIDLLKVRIPREQWTFVNVTIAPSTITITEHEVSEALDVWMVNRNVINVVFITFTYSTSKNNLEF